MDHSSSDCGFPGTGVKSRNQGRTTDYTTTDHVIRDDQRVARTHLAKITTHSIFDVLRLED